MESLIRQWDGENVVVQHDRPSGAWILIAIHSTRLGPATGGTRMKPYPDLESALRDALRLSGGMTFKWAMSEFARGGGKAVIKIPTDLPRQARGDLLRRYGTLVKKLGGLFYTGPDVGTTSEDMDIIAETGSPYVHSRTPGAGGAGSSGTFTALGVFTAIQVACEHVYGTSSLNGRRVLVQGVGSVGEPLIRRLVEAGAEVSFSDVVEETIVRIRDQFDVPFVPEDCVYSYDCDVFAPCALGGVLNSATIPHLKCRVVAGGANNQLAEFEEAARLKATGILYAPDYVVNLGGAIAITGMESMGWSHEEAAQKVLDNIQKALRQIFELADAEQLTTETAARRIAEQRLSTSAKS